MPVILKDPFKPTQLHQLSSSPNEKMSHTAIEKTEDKLKINPTDPLPKTVCIPCIDRLEVHHELMEQFLWARKHLAIASSAESSDVRDIRKQFNQELRAAFAWLQFVFYPLPRKRSAPIHLVSSARMKRDGLN
uniref:Uncharacterized protein n=2 Tax=Timema TaxID=61471 RepID=A0A7R9AMA9_TIMSH|nr:unnamed protein product [Timema shepardi]CAD7570762.1 unnamed protein product [Timema californicum]